MNQYAIIVVGDCNDADYLTKVIPIGSEVTEFHKEICEALQLIKSVDGNGEYGRPTDIELFNLMPKSIQKQIKDKLIKENGIERFNEYGEDWCGDAIREYIPYYEYCPIHTIKSACIIEYKVQEIYGDNYPLNYELWKK